MAGIGNQAWIIPAAFGVIGAVIFISKMMKSGKSPILSAATRGDGHAVARLLKNGVDINSYNGIGQTALICAAEHGHTKVVDYIIQKGGNVNAISGPQRSVNIGTTALMLAAQNGHTAVVQKLLDKGADQSIKNEKGLTALMLAAWKGNVDTVNILLKAGGDLRVKCNWSRNAWNWAQESRDKKKMEVLKAATFADR